MPNGLDCLPVSASTQMRDRSFQVPNNGLWPGPMGDHLDDEVDFMHRERHQECTALSVDPRAVAWARRLPRHHIAGNTWAWIGTVSLPEYGPVRLVVATYAARYLTRHGNLRKQVRIPGQPQNTDSRNESYLNLSHV